MAITAIFDGRCAICQGTRRVVQALDWLKRVEFLDLHAEAQVAQRFPHLDPAAMMGEIHVVDGRGGLYRGFLGTRRMLRELPLGWPLWVLLHLPGMAWLGARLYRFIARRRYAINRLLGIDLGPDCTGASCRLEP